MKACRMKLAELQKPERNTRIHTEAQLRELERSVTMFGQIRPIIVDENNVILAGNGLYGTLLRLGWEEAEVYQYDTLSENQKKKLMIADNKIYGLGVDDYDTLDAFLLELKDDLDIPGFDADILKNMTAAADDITAAMSDYGKLSPEEATSIAAAGERKREAADTAEAGERASRPLQRPQTADRDKPEVITCPECGAVICP
ncbi:MAG: ParB/Srx family N-terminal domain-containing protein [Oscillospiraceae bacterium]|jgi:ParB-like chromosome segregation protein Spo0J|nr:ParB/Srx family N-terminal domain-containing protein [Oscillospiraceae bacterium]